MFNPSIGEVDPSARQQNSHKKSLDAPAENIRDHNHNIHSEGNTISSNFRVNKGVETGESTREFNVTEDFTSQRSLTPFEFSERLSDSDEDDYNVDIDSSLYPNGGVKALLVILGAFLSCFTCFGIMNAMGAIEAFVQSNQLYYDSVSAVSWIFSIYMFVSLFSGLFVGPLYDTFGAKHLTIIGSILTFVGLFATASCSAIYQFILAFGVCTGLGTGFMMFPSVSVVSTWFDRTKRSFYIGIVQAGGSVGGICFPILLRYLFAKYGFEWAMRIFAFINLGVDIVAVILINDRLDIIKEALGEVDDRTFIGKFKDSFDFNAFKDKKFMSLTAALFMNEFSLLIVLTYLASYAMAFGATVSESYLMLTVLNISGTFGKFIPSYFSQKLGTFNMMILMSFTMSLELFIIWLPFGKYKVALYIFIVLFGFGYAATYSLTGATIGTVTKKTKDFGKRYGSAYAIVSFGNLISLPISGSFIVEKSQSDYTNMVAFAAAACATATALFIISRWCVVGTKVWVVI